MYKYKAGDGVKCIKPPIYNKVLTEGKIYEIIAYINGAITLKSDNNTESTWFDDRFELAYTKPIVDEHETSVIMTLPTNSNERKDYPLFRGCLRYFPAALAGVSRTSKLGNDKHNPGEDMHHARNKSSDQGDCIMRHLVDVEDLLTALNRGDSKVTQQDILNEVNQMAWRALAFSQELHEKFGAPMAPGAKK
jgi:hypothetical protein